MPPEVARSLRAAARSAEHDVPFGNGPHIAGEPQRCELVEGTTIETVSGEPREIVVVEREVLEHCRARLSSPAATRKPRSGGRSRTNRLNVADSVIPRDR